MSLLEVIKLSLHCTRRGRAPFCLRWKVTEKAWNDHCADRECELRFARAIREAVSLGQSGFARVGGFGFAGEMREPALRRRAGWTRQHDEPLVKNRNEKILHLANKGEVISELARTGEHHSSESNILSISDVVAMRGLGAKSSESSIVASKSSTVPTVPKSAFSKV